MKYWALSAIVNNMLMPPELAGEFHEMARTNKVVSQAAFHAAFHVTACVPGRDLDRLVFQPNTGTADRRFYLDYPETKDWLILERGGVYENEDGYRFLFLDALH